MKGKSGHKLIYLFCLMLCFLGISAYTKTQASSADIVINSDKTDYYPGDNVDIYIDIEADILPGDFEGCLTFPSDILEYVSGPDIVVEGEGEVLISDQPASVPNRNTRRYSLRFKALKPGSADICFEDVPEIYEYEEGYLMSVSVNELRITVIGETATPTPTPTPSPKPTSTPVPEPSQVPDDDEAKQQDEGTVKVDPNKKKISAISENDVVRIFSDVGFIVDTEKQDIEIPEGYERTSMVIDGIRIPVYTSDNPEDYMLIPIKTADGTVLYSYDRTEKTLQRYKDNSATVVKHIMTDSIEALELANSYEKSLNVMTLIIAILAGVAMSLLIILIRVALKHRGDDPDSMY